MSLDNISKTHLHNILQSLYNDNNETKIVDNIKQNHAEYAQLKLISRQIQQLENEAREIINSSTLNNKLRNIKSNLKFVSGNYYYLYESKTDSSLLWSIIGPYEWKSKNRFIGKFMYDYDKTFIKIEN